MHLGLALGGGGARGLAHVLMLEVFDELGVRPKCIAGTSMVLVDGGSVNPVPFDLLQDDCDTVIAINVVGKRRRRSNKPPNLTAAIFNTYQIMQMSIVRQKLRQRPPTIYIEPDLVDIRMLEFYKADEIFDQARPAKAQLKHLLSALLQ